MRAGGGACAALVPPSRIKHHCCIFIILSRMNGFSVVPDEKNGRCTSSKGLVGERAPGRRKRPHPASAPPPPLQAFRFTVFLIVMGIKTNKYIYTFKYLQKELYARGLRPGK